MAISVLNVLPEDLSLVPRTQIRQNTAICSSFSRESDALFLVTAGTHTKVTRHSHRHTYIHIKKESFFYFIENKLFSNTVHPDQTQFPFLLFFLASPTTSLPPDICISPQKRAGFQEAKRQQNKIQ